MATEEYRLEPMGDDIQRPLLATTCKRIHFGKQMRQLLLAGARRWLVTAACIGAIYVTLAHYSDKVVMSTVKKRMFNGAITGLSIALGLSIASSLKWMASELKWWVLSCKGWTLQEVDLILHGESISHLIKLSHVSRAWSTHVYVSLWILLNIASQVAVAMLGLTYSVGQNDETALTKPGDVRIPDMTTIKGERLITSTQVGTPSELQYTANSYGFIAVAYGVGTLDDVPPPRTLTDAISYLYYCGTDRCEYYFSEMSPREDSRSHISVTTSRSVASSGSCMSWPVIEGGGGNSTSITVSGGPNGSTLKKDIPIAGGVDQTTFMVNTSQACGPACSQISAFEASATAPWYYECSVTIAKVANATLPEHQLGQNLTTLASAAIALQGVGTSSLSRDQTAQFQSYPAEAIFGAPQNGSTGGMGRLMAQFAMGVVAVTAQYNPKITTRGGQPIVGTKLDVNWNNVHLVLLITGCVQLCLTLAAVMIANRVVARDDGPLATARLLKSAITYPDDRASTASGKEIAKACGGKTRFVYGVQTQRTKAGDVYHVQIREGAPTPKPFPPGLYD